MFYRKVMKWLYPGMKIKRWLGLFALGVLIGGVGISLIFTYRYIGMLEEYIFYLVYQNTGQYYHMATLIGGIVIVIVGLVVMAFAARQIVYSVFMYALPDGESSLLEIIFKKRKLHKGPHVVVVGGGTGLSTLLRGLKSITSNITAIVTVADDGGSSGRLRQDFGIIPPGDLRNCLVAMADAEPLMERLMQHRFKGDNPLSGHSFGNLFIAAMAQVNDGDITKALDETSKLLALRGRVVPASMDTISLCAEMSDGTIVEGESQIPKVRKRIKRVFMKQENISITPSALEAVSQADIIILGPGSLYTSIMPNIILPGFADALRAAKAKKVYVCNVMTQPGETDNYTASRHVKAIIAHGGPKIIDYAVVNIQGVAQNLKDIYQADGAYPVQADIAKIEKLGIKVVEANLISETDLVRHDPIQLSRTIVALIYDLQSIKTKVWDRFLISDNEMKLGEQPQDKKTGH